MNPTAYPLAWPAGWPRTEGRLRGPYRTELPTALKNLRSQVKMLAGDQAARGLVLSSNCTLGNDSPRDPGVVAFFTYGRMQVAIPCDRWGLVAQNVQAIALTIEAMRAIERHGAKHMVKAMFSGFAALPEAGPGQRPWRDVLSVSPGAPLEAVEQHYRMLAKKAHPDAPGGSHEQMAVLNAAIAEARKELGG